MILPEVLREDLVDEVVGVVLIHLDFFHDHAALASDVGAIEYWIQYQVAEDVERHRYVLVKNLDVEEDAFLGGESIHIPANRIELTCDFLGATVLRPFEDHVLDEVRDPIPFGIFVARTRLQPHSDRCRPDVLHLLGNHCQTVGQFLTPNVADFLSHEILPAEIPSRTEDRHAPGKDSNYSYIGQTSVRK